MDWEGKFDHPRLLCAATQQPIAPGGVFWSALLQVPNEERFARRDFSDAAWPNVDRTGFLSWWRQTLPKPDEHGPKAIDIEALLGMFHALKDSHDRAKQCFCYVVLLFLVRARKLKYREVRRIGDHSYLIVEDKVNRCSYQIRDPGLSPSEEAQVQQNFREITELGAPAPTA
jgi:hypothetical protein